VQLALQTTTTTTMMLLLMMMTKNASHMHQKRNAALLANPNRATRALTAKLCEAVRNRDATLVKRLLREGANVNSCDDWGAAALHYACVASALATLLMAHGAQVSLNGRDGQPIHFAAQNGHNRLISMLVEHGANVDAGPSHAAAHGCVKRSQRQYQVARQARCRCVRGRECRVGCRCRSDHFQSATKKNSDSVPFMSFFIFPLFFFLFSF
jgi:hypothetical protein